MNFVFALFSILFGLVAGTATGVVVGFGLNQYVEQYIWISIGGGVITGVYIFGKVFEYYRSFFKF